MTKQEFCDILEIIIDSYEKNTQFTESVYEAYSKYKDTSFIDKFAFKEVFKDTLIADRLIEYLDKLFDCEYGISWWIYEMHCGKNPHTIRKDKSGTEHTVYNIDDLWNMITYK